MIVTFYISWMAHTLERGILSSISTRLTGNNPVPFGNVYSFVDGPCNNATGTPYPYGTSMHQTFADALSNPTVALTLLFATTNIVLEKSTKIFSSILPSLSYCALRLR
jgi:hypothetical protein